MEKYISNYTGEQIDALLSQIQSNVSQADLDILKTELVLRLQGSSSSQDGYKDPVFYKEFVGSATLQDMNAWLDNQFFAIKDGVYYRNGQSGSYAISKDVPQCLVNLSYQGVKIYVFNSPRSYATGTFEQFAIGAAVSGNGITWGSGIMRRKSTYNFSTKQATWTAWEKINSDVDKAYVDTQLATKVDKVSGKGLSTNDYTTAEKTKLAGVATGANKTIVDTTLSTTSTNPVQNKAVAASLNAKVNIILGKGLSTNDYTTADKNLVATIPSKADKTYVDTQLATKTSKEYVDDKVKEANANAANAAKIRTEDMQYMGVAFDSEEMTTLRFRASENPTSKNIGDTITLTDVAGQGADVSVILKITEGQTIVVENSGMPSAVLLSVGGNDAKIVAKTQTGEVLCVYTCPLGEEFIYIYGTSAKYRIYKKPYVLELSSVYEKVDEISSNYVDAPTFIAATNGLDTRKADKTYVDAQLDTKVSKIAGKGLSTNDFSNDYKAKVDNYSAGVIYNYIDGLTYIYKSDDNIVSAGVGDNISIYDDERGNISNFFSIEPGSIIVCDNNPILEYVSPSQLCVLAVPDATGKCTYSNNTGSTRDICVLANSNARMEVSLSSIQTAIRDANKVAQKVENLANAALSQVALLIPESLSVEAPKRLTWGNKVTNYIKAVLAPSNVVQNIIYISDNKAVEVGTDGSINVIAKGISRVHVIPTNKTALAKTIQIEVGDPRLRISAKTKLRFTANGSMRLT